MLGEPYSLGGLWSYPKEEFGRTRDRPRRRAAGPARRPPHRQWRDLRPRPADGRPSYPATAGHRHRLEPGDRAGDAGSGSTTAARAQPGRVIGLSRPRRHAARHPGRRHRPGADDGGGRAEPRAGPRPADDRARRRRRSRRRRPRRSSARPWRRCPAPAGDAAARGAARPAGRDGGRCRRRVAARPAARGAGAAPCHARPAFRGSRHLLPPRPGDAPGAADRRPGRAFRRGPHAAIPRPARPLRRMSPRADRAVAAVLAAGLPEVKLLVE